MNYRKTDPPTSKLAGQEANASGLAKRQRQLCLETIRTCPGQTAREIEAQLGIKAHKRLPELRTYGLVRNGQTRTCTVSGRQALTWIPLNIN